MTANRAVVFAMMAVMTTLVFINVIARYLFNFSIIWAEEISQYLMIWIAYLGAGLALREGRHVALELLHDRLTPVLTRRLRMVLGGSRARLPRSDYGPRVPVLDVRLGPGNAGLEHLARHSHARHSHRVSALCRAPAADVQELRRPEVRSGGRPGRSVRGGGLSHGSHASRQHFWSGWGSASRFRSSWAGSGFMALLYSGKLSLLTAPQRFFNGINSFPLMAVPFFILAADLMSASGITMSLLRFTTNFVGHIRGGLGHVNVLTLMLFAGISGSALADAAGPGALIMRMMKKTGYDEYYSAALTASTAIMGPIIPPSIIMVIYAITDSKVDRRRPVPGWRWSPGGAPWQWRWRDPEPHHRHPPVTISSDPPLVELEGAPQEHLAGGAGVAHARDHHRRDPVEASSPLPKPSAVAVFLRPVRRFLRHQEADPANAAQGRGTERPGHARRHS